MVDSDIEKKIVYQLMENQGKLFGEVVKDYFPEGLSIFCCQERNIAAIFWEEGYKQDMTSIVSFLSLYNYLIENRMLFCLPHNGGKAVMFAKEKNSLVLETRNEDLYYNDSRSYRMTENGVRIEDDNGNIIQEINSCPCPLSSNIISALCCSVYSTSRLKDFCDNGYKSFEIRTLEEQMNKTQKSLCLAWCTLIFSLILPFVMTFFNNCHSKSTITDSQMSFFKQQMCSVSSHLDSIDVHLNNIEHQSSQSKKCSEQ